jgi:hypothetical protein
MDLADIDGVHVQPSKDSIGNGTTLTWHETHGDTPYYYDIYMSNGTTSIGKLSASPVDPAKSFISLNFGLFWYWSAGV